MIRFDPPALHAALDAERGRRGASWADVARETGVAAATIARLRGHGRFETDGILQLTRWLGRPIEDFTTDDSRRDHGRVPDLPVTAALAIPEGELTERFSRSGGPGGQHVNTTDTRVELSWDIGASEVLSETQRARLLANLAPRLVRAVLTIAASEHRSQTANRRAARERFAAIVREASAPPPPPRRPTRRTRGSNERRIAAKKQRGETKRGRRSGWD